MYDIITLENQKEEAKMKLGQIKNWKAVHMEDRTILKSDKSIYPASTWKEIENLDVVEMKEKGHYKVI